MSTDDTNAARRGSGSNDLLGPSTALADLHADAAKRMSAFDCLACKPALRDRIAMAKEHMMRERQQHDALWPHQRFSLTLGELLDAAERGAYRAGNRGTPMTTDRAPSY